MTSNTICTDFRFLHQVTTCSKQGCKLKRRSEAYVSLHDDTHDCANQLNWPGAPTPTSLLEVLAFISTTRDTLSKIEKTMKIVQMFANLGNFLGVLNFSKTTKVKGYHYQHNAGKVRFPIRKMRLATSKKCRGKHKRHSCFTTQMSKHPCIIQSKCVKAVLWISLGHVCGFEKV